MLHHRIVSLIASATEIVCALGFRDQLVGRSHECDFPESVGALPVCTKPKFNPEGSSSEIDERVKQVLANAGASIATQRDPKVALSVYEVFSNVLETLRPDVIVTQSHCEVCAVSLREVERAVSTFVSSRPRIVSLEPNFLEDVWKDIQSVADALEVPKRGARLIEELRDRMAVISDRANSSVRRPTVAYIEWIEPLMAGGNWMPELIEMAGGENLFGEHGKHSPWMTFDQLVEKDPDIIVVAPCGFDMKRSEADLPLLVSKPGWEDLEAVRNQKLFVADGKQYFNRPGPRLVESLEILAEIFHPDAFHFGHEGTGWVRS